MENLDKIENLLVRLLNKMDKLMSDEHIPKGRLNKNLVVVYDFRSKSWIPFKSVIENHAKLHGRYFSTTPTILTEIEEAWSPLRVDSAGKLIVADISTIKDDIALIKADIIAIKAQTDKLTFTGANDVLTVHETAPT